MPHVMLERLRTMPGYLRRVTLCYGIEALAITADVIFVVSSCGFCPPFVRSLEIFVASCVGYALGSLIYLGLALLSTWEASRKHGWESIEVYENLAYLVGSLVFFLGTILYWPSKADRIHWLLDFDNLKDLSIGSYFNLMSPEFEGTLLFIAGSVLFVFAAFMNGLNHNNHLTTEGKMLTATTTLFMGGSVLFVMGSVGMLPDLGCGEAMYDIGAGCYVLGSLFFLAGSVVSLARVHRMVRDPEMMELSDAKTLDDTNIQHAADVNLKTPLNADAR